MSSTTRHLINRQRRLAAASAAARGEARTGAAVRRPPGVSRPSADHRVMADAGTVPAQDDPAPEDAAPEDAEAAPAAAGSGRSFPPARLPRVSRATALLGLLALLTVALGCFAAVASGKASALRDTAARRNSALTDTARTSEVKGGVAQDVDAVFSYDYADPARTDQAARRLLTGAATKQYASMIAGVKAQARAQKLVLTTTVTDTGVQMINDDRARVLVFADQSNTSTATKGAGATYAAAMFAVDAVRQGGVWKLSSIDTFG
jgi:Mce-associated membrane protein